MSALIRQRGISLVELVVAIVVISVAVAGTLLAFNQTTRRSADAMVEEQAVAIAEAYLEEILLKPFSDPDGIDGEVGRVNFDDIDDYNGLLDNGARDQDDAPIAGLGGYVVQVSVLNEALNGVPAPQSLRADVRVTHATLPEIDILLSGYRTDYP